tara:strand:- start:2655 stop:3140 length:486 start_codon:yes stop_codon:yes gene_type:complete
LTVNKTNFLIDFIIVLILFSLDRISKLYIINLFENNNFELIELTNFFNVYLIWNNGIAFGLFSLDSSILYNIFTLLIIIINIVIVYLIFKAKDFTKYFYIIIFGGSLGNLFDRLYYRAVPDFIDLYISNFHWFIFNIADIFISIGIFCLIFVELFVKKKND